MAPDLEQLQRRIENKESVWCGWDRFFGASDTECVTRISPFGQTLVAVADSKGTQRLQSGASPTCSLTNNGPYAATDMRPTFSLCSNMMSVWQDDLFKVFNCLCEYLNVVVSADSDDQS